MALMLWIVDWASRPDDMGALLVKMEWHLDRGYYARPSVINGKAWGKAPRIWRNKSCMY